MDIECYFESRFVPGIVIFAEAGCQGFPISQISHLHGLFLSPLPCCPHSRSISEFFSEVQPGIVRYAAWYAAAGKISDYLTIPWDILRHGRNWWLPDLGRNQKTRPVSRWSNQHAGASRGSSAHRPYGSYGPYGSCGYYMDHVDLLWSFSCVSFSKRVMFRVFWNIWFLTSVSFFKNRTSDFYETSHSLQVEFF